MTNQKALEYAIITQGAQEWLAKYIDRIVTFSHADVLLHRPHRSERGQRAGTAAPIERLW
jgi:hypothetical protein